MDTVKIADSMSENRHTKHEITPELRRNLSVLKKALAGESLVVDREIIGLTRDADSPMDSASASRAARRTGQALWLDVDEFRGLVRAWQGHGHAEAGVCPECLIALAEAAELHRGDFLAGFGLRDSVNFDDWQFFQTEGLRQELALALERLVRGHSARGRTNRPSRTRGVCVSRAWHCTGHWATAGGRPTP